MALFTRGRPDVAAHHGTAQSRTAGQVGSPGLPCLLKCVLLTVKEEGFSLWENPLWGIGSRVEIAAMRVACTDTRAHTYIHSTRRHTQMHANTLADRYIRLSHTKLRSFLC